MNPDPDRLIVEITPISSFLLYPAKFQIENTTQLFLAQFKRGQTFKRAFRLLRDDGYRPVLNDLAKKAWQGVKGQDQYKNFLVIEQERLGREPLLVTSWSESEDGVTKQNFENEVVPPSALVVVEWVGF